MRSFPLKVALNFSSTVLPMLVGLLTIPLIIKGIGVERFGMLSIAWMIVGYFGLLDMGLGRALTQKVAYKIGAGETETLRSLILFALLAVGGLGVVGSTVVYGFSEQLVYDVFNISDQFKAEALKGIYWVALTIPFAILSTCLFGILEGQHFFGWVAIVRAPLNLMMFLGPLFAIHWSASLDVVFASLFLVRLVGFFALVLIVSSTLKEFSGWARDAGELKGLFAYGGWVTVSNIVSPMMVYFDRFYIATVLSVSVVAYYTTPVDFLIKFLLVPLSLVGVLFPSFSAGWHASRRAVVKNYWRSVFVVSLVMIPFTLLVYVFADLGIALWLGEEFSENSYPIAKVIAVGLLFNGLAMVPYAFIQAVGRADITAKCHILELPMFAVLLVIFVEWFGILGAAFAWSIRVVIDCFLLYFISNEIMRRGAV